MTKATDAGTEPVGEETECAAEVELEGEATIAEESSDAFLEANSIWVCGGVDSISEVAVFFEIGVAGVLGD